MAIEALGAGSIATANVRRELADVELPAGSHFILRSSHDGPLTVTTLAIDLYLSPLPPVQAVNGWAVVPIEQPLEAGQRIGWSVWAPFAVPMMATYLLVNGSVSFLGRKEDSSAGKIWSSEATLRDHHLAGED